MVDRPKTFDSIVVALLTLLALPGARSARPPKLLLGAGPLAAPGTRIRRGVRHAGSLALLGMI